jgi:glycosyltransferase involved in cell wall biosynthesis
MTHGAGRPRKILLLSRSIPPGMTGSAIIVGNLAKQFSPEEMIVAGEGAPGRPPVSWSPEWAPITTLYTGWAEDQRGLRWLRRLKVPELLARTVSLIRREKITDLLVVFPNEEFLLVGYLASRITGVNLYPYFHNTYAENRPGRRHAFALALQKRVFDRARHVFVMSEGMARLYRRNYPNLHHCSPLLHSFNESLPTYASPPAPGDPVQLAFCGTINDSCLEAMRRLSQAVLELPNTHLRILSGSSVSLLGDLNGAQDRVVAGPVSRDELLNHLRAADFVLLPHGFTGRLSAEEYETIFPTKTIEYLICGRPILAHAPANSYLSAFLRENDCALLVTDPDPAALRDAVQQLCADPALRDRLVRNALAAASQFQAPTVAGALRTVVQENSNVTGS